MSIVLKSMSGYHFPLLLQWSRMVKNIGGWWGGGGGEGADRESLNLEFYVLFWTDTLILG